jgi:hypothetical protein
MGKAAGGRGHGRHRRRRAEGRPLGRAAALGRVVAGRELLEEPLFAQPTLGARLGRREAREQARARAVVVGEERLGALGRGPKAAPRDRGLRAAEALRRELGQRGHARGARGRERDRHVLPVFAGLLRDDRAQGELGPRRAVGPPPLDPQRVGRRPAHARHLVLEHQARRALDVVGLRDLGLRDLGLRDLGARAARAARGERHAHGLLQHAGIDPRAPIPLFVRLTLLARAHVLSTGRLDLGAQARHLGRAKREQLEPGLGRRGAHGLVVFGGPAAYRRGPQRGEHRLEGRDLGAEPSLFTARLAQQPLVGPLELGEPRVVELDPTRVREHVTLLDADAERAVVEAERQPRDAHLGWGARHAR